MFCLSFFVLFCFVLLKGWPAYNAAHLVTKTSCERLKGGGGGWEMVRDAFVSLCKFYSLIRNLSHPESSVKQSIFMHLELPVHLFKNQMWKGVVDLNERKYGVVFTAMQLRNRPRIKLQAYSVLLNPS